MKLLDAFLDLLYPPKCPFCGKVQETRGICPSCSKALPRTEGDQGLKTLPGGTVCAAPLWYEGLVRDGLLRFKFQGASAAAEPLGELVAQCAAERFSGEFDVVTWVPVSRRRLRKRGYDQARLLAESACRVWGVKPGALLRKVRHNPAQSGLTEAAARRANVLGVYEPTDAGRIQGRRVLLVDDICTTGATLAECARVLREAGAEKVVCVTAALTREKEKVHKAAKE